MVTNVVATTRVMPIVTVAPSVYIQGRGVLPALGESVSPLGKSALMIADDTVWPIAGHEIERILQAANVKITGTTFRGECSENEINRICQESRDRADEIVVGVGGGKVLDTAKSVAQRLNKRCVLVATIASANAPVTNFAMIYSDNGVFERYEHIKQSPDVVLIDTEVVAKSEDRWLKAGMGDALATWVEARANHESRHATLQGGVTGLTGMHLAKLCRDTIFNYGVAALRSMEQKAVTTAVERVVEANTLISGLGLENCGLAATHAIYNGLTVLQEQTRNIPYGEKIAFSTLVHLMLEGRPTEELIDYMEFYVIVNLPVTLAELNLPNVSRDDLRRVAEKACDQNGPMRNMPFFVNTEMALDAILAADAFGREFKNKKKMSLEGR